MRVLAGSFWLVGGWVGGWVGGAFIYFLEAFFLGKTTPNDIRFTIFLVGWSVGVLKTNRL